MDEKPYMYGKCDHIPKTKMDLRMGQEVAKNLDSTYDLLPIFEKDTFERAFIKHYSLVRNERLRCRWVQYVRTIETRKFAPFQFPDIRDLHVYNCAIRIHPTATIWRQDHRKKLKPGPGFDYGGQMPIPQEAMMKRGKSEPKTPLKKAGKTKDTTEEKDKKKKNK